ncbi:unnamed protein product [Mycena citricolor]|uniref:N-acetyltransferase domain-containing protein n=1 Tax=Mycena citricolor TaxID=2018698 RepID=A0AAD2HCM3_9AGAR|nr:unnamed protein product [Mycena citricolor]
MILDKPLFSKSGKLVLMPRTSADDEAVARLRMTPSTRKFMVGLPKKITAETVRRAREAGVNDPTRLQFAIYTTGTNGAPVNFVGETSLYMIDHERSCSCEAGIVVRPEYFGKAFATDAMYTLLGYVYDVMKIHRVYLYTDTRNKATQAWAERGGWKLEGIARDVTPLENGRYQDECQYSLLETDWRSHTKAWMERNGEVGSVARL